MKEITPEDIRALTDPAADPDRRAQSLSRLAYWELGKYDYLESTIAGLLSDSSAVVRGAAATTLLAGWKREKYVDAVTSLLLSDRDEDWNGRSEAAFALAQFTRSTGKQRHQIIRTLIQALISDPAWPVQSAAYRGLLRILAPDRDVPIYDDFDPKRDVDWELLGPYLVH